MITEEEWDECPWIQMTHGDREFDCINCPVDYGGCWVEDLRNKPNRKIHFIADIEDAIEDLEMLRAKVYHEY
jgi:hypothetical protein